MNTRLIKLVIVLLAIFSFNSLSAGCFIGAEISYQNIGGNTYKVQYILYRDCSAISAPNAISLNLSCQSNSSYSFTVNANKVGNAVVITQSCPLVPSSCNGGGNSVYGVEKHVFEAIVTLPACGDWLISFTSGNRSPMTNIINGNYYIVSRLNNSIVNNSSPIFDNDMIPLINCYSQTQLNYGGYDPDGDSLSYSLYAPFIQNMAPITYNTGYSATNFMQSNTPINLDSITGLLSIKPSSPAYSTLGIKVDEWRSINGVMTNIATTYRDFTLKASVSYSSITPVLSGIDLSASHSYSPNDTISNVYVCYDGNPITFRINGLDSNIADPNLSGYNEVFDISWNNGLANTVFTAHNNGTDSAYADFVWTPDSSDINVKKSFVVRITDHACSHYAFNDRGYSITLIEPDLSISNDTAVCHGEDVSIITNSSEILNSFSWTIDGDSILGQSGDTLVINTDNYTHGTHIIEVEAFDTIYGSLCSQIEQMTLIIDEHSFEQASFPDTAYCAGDNVAFDAGNAITYKWINNLGAVLSTDRYYTPTSSGMLFVEAYNNTCISMDAFNVSIYDAPAFSFGNDTTITINQTLYLEMPAGYSDYLWSDGSTAQSLTIDNTFDWQNAISGRILEGGICTSTDTIIVKIGSVGISEVQKSDINIYPNPINDVLSIELNKESENVSIQLYDISSKLIRDEVFSGKEFKLNGLSDLPSGNYILKIINGDSILEYKIIKK